MADECGIEENCGRQIDIFGHNRSMDAEPRAVEPSVVDWDFPRSSASVALLARYADERGVSRDAVLRGSGVTVADLDDPELQIDARAELAVIRNLVAALGAREGLGLDVGRRYRITTFGIFGFAMVSSPTLGEAIALALRYLELSFTFCIPVVELGDGEVIGRLHEERVPDDVRRFLVERDVAAMYTVLGDLLGGERLPLQRIGFRFAEPSGLDEYRDLYGITPVFGTTEAFFTFAPAQLNRSLPQANSNTWAMCQAQCRDLVARRRLRTGIAHDVRDKLIRLGGAPAGIDEVARELNMSTRTLRRRLTDGGTSYRALLDEVREALAEEMLVTTPMSVSDIAISLGYAEASTFIYAFKRWTGTTPAAYQRDRRRSYVGSGG